MADFFAPSYWYGAGPDFSGLANAQASQGQTNNWNAQQANTLATANAFNPFANSGGSFGAQPAAYAGLGAAYGRSTGGFGGAPGRVGTIGNPGKSNPGYMDFGGGADQEWYRGGSQGARPSSGGGIGSDMHYGGQGMGSPSGTVSRSRLDPADRGDPYFMDSDPAGFNPSRYGGIGSDARFGGQKDIDWMLGGSQGPRPSSVFNTGTSPVNTYGGGANPGGFSPSPNYPGGQADIDWMKGGSQGSRPSSGQAGIDADNEWYLGGSKGARPSSSIMGYSGGGIGSDAARVPAASPNRPRFPVQSQDWNTTFNNMTGGDSSQPYPLGSPSWYPSQRGGGRSDLAAMMAAAQDRMRAGQGWTIAEQPYAASQGTLTSRINQSIYDLGNAGTAYGQQVTPQELIRSPNPGG